MIGYVQKLSDEGALSTELLAEVEALAGLGPTAAATDPAAFRSQLLIDCDGTPTPFGAVIDPWQSEDFKALDAGWQRVAGLRSDASVIRAYLERARGHSKTTDFAVMVLWVLFASKAVIQGVAAAADKDQAKLLANQAAQVLSHNPWLSEQIEVNRYEIKNKRTGSRLDILASDAGSSYGLTPDFVIIDELTHWKKRDMWDSLISSAAKRHNCMVVVISNAGVGKGISWQWDAREACRTSENWYFKRQEGPVASWITPERLKEQRILIPGKAYQRLWLNEWTTEQGDALDMADIDACTVRKGPIYEYGNGQLDFVAGLDLGIKNDYSSLVVLGLDRSRARVVLARVWTWKPTDYESGKVQLSDVRETCRESAATYRLAGIAFDPWQCLGMAQELDSDGINMVEWIFNSRNLSTMATNLLDVFKNRTIELYPHEGLIHDLMRLSIVERPQGFKIEAVSDEKGHADRATALAIALPLAISVFNDGAGQEQDEYLPTGF